MTYAGWALVVLALSVVTVLRYTVDYLQADGVQQSTMSVQDVDLFFWGQNRFAAFVSALASPISNPEANLFACLLINAVSFHVFLLILARMGTRVVSGSRRPVATLIAFLALAASAHLLIAPAALHILSLESQPYSMSWALTLGGFLLWKRDRWWQWVLAGAMVFAAAGLNQSTIVVAAFLAVLELLRRRQWLRWVAFGVVWVVSLGVWTVLSSRFGGNAGPIPDANTEYFSFSVATVTADAGKSLTSILSAFRILRLLIAVVVAALGLLLLNAERRATLLQRFALILVFATGYWALFTGNPWVSANGFALRYFFPVILFVALCVGASLGTVLAGVVEPQAVLHPRVLELVGRARSSAGRPRAGLARPAVAVALPALLLVAALVGPMHLPWNATVLQQTRATAEFARANDTRFISGYYWDMWPTLWGALEDGRHASFVTGFKSGGDPAAYKGAFESQLSEGHRPAALCVNQSVSFCQTYLDYWTRAGWRDTGRTCPVPGDSPLLGSPPQRSCLVLEYAG